MNKEKFIKQRCEIDKITEEEFERTYRVVECNCGKIYCKGYRCLDLDGLLKENQELKKRLENISEELELVRCDLHNRTSERDGYERELNEYRRGYYKQKEVIDKAIEKIKKGIFIVPTDTDDVLDILKEVSE